MANRIVSVTLRGNVTNLVGGLRAAGASVGDLSNRMTASGREADAMRRNLSAVGDGAGRMGLAVSAGVALAAKAAIDWESAWAGVTKTVDGSTEQMSDLEEGLRNLAKTLPATHSEIAAVAEAAGQLGVARGDIVSFTKTMIDLGETTNLTADEAATSIAQFANVIGLTGDDVDNLGSVLVALGNDGASTERDIIQMAQRIAGAGRTVGLTAGEVLAFANTVASMGIEVEAGGTAVSTVFATMARAAASGGPKLDAFAATAGVTAEQFAKSFKEKPAEAMVSFIKGLERTQQAGGNLYAQLDAVGLQDVRVSQALIGMASSGDLLTDSLKLQATEWDRNRALTDESSKRYDTTAAKASIAWNNIKDSAIDAGQAMLPIVEALADAVTTLTGGFGKLSPEVQSGLTVVAAVGGASLIATAGLVKVLGAASATRKAMTELRTTSPRLATALGGVGKAAGVTAIALGGLRIAGELMDTDDTASVAQFTKAILDLADGKKTLDGTLSNSKGLVSSAKGFSDLAATIKEADPSWVNDKFGKLFGVVKMNPYQDAMDDVKAYDNALTSLVTQGALEEAALGQEAFAEAAKEAGRSTGDVKSLLPGYYEALTEVDTGQRIAATSANKLGDAAGAAGEEVKTLSEALSSMLDPLLNQEDASNAWKDSLASLAEAVKETGTSLDDNTVKGRANQDAIRERVQALKDSVAADEEAGVGQEELARKLERGRSHILAAGEAAGFSRREMKDYIDQLGLTPENIDTLVDVKTGDAFSKLTTLKGLMDAIKSKEVFVNVTKIENLLPGAKPKANGGAILRATGGSVIGPGTGTSDSIPAVGPGSARYLLSNGEHILTAGEVDKLGGQSAVYAMREQIRNGARFAAGGAVNVAAPSVSMSGGMTAAEFGAELRRVLSRGSVRIVGPAGNQRLELMGA